jgi:enoyl-CoA hydratase/carnithine racemase
VSVIHEQRDSIALVRLNRPEKFNSLTREMILALSDLFKQFTGQPDLRAVILTGTGDRAFCAGTDISELSELTETMRFKCRNVVKHFVI